MSDGYNQDFDLLALLKFGDFDIRGIAAAQSSITVGEYLGLVSKFIGHATLASAVLTNFAKLGDVNAIKALEEVLMFMTNTGCNKLIPEIKSIIDAYNNRDKELAAQLAKKISDDFSELYKRTMAARKKSKSEISSEIPNENILSDNFASHGQSSLKELLKQLDAEEATRKLRILAVDDSAVILRIITSALSDHYKVFTLAKPMMLEKMLQQITPELFLLDYRMPELSGFDLIPIIRSFKEHKDTPIIFLTSEGTLENLSAAVMLGASDFVVKPVRPEILREKIANHIVRKKLF